MAPDSIRKQALWLYGVIIGLALKEAFVLTLPHVVETQKPFHVRSEHFTEGLRLFCFIVLAIRFYFGAVVYFEEAYEKQHPPPEGSAPGTPSANKYPTKSFGTDFIFGFFHFILFFALAISIPTHSDTSFNQDTFRLGLFLGLLILILLYDAFWLCLNWFNSTFELIQKWAFLNGVTVLAMIVIYGCTLLYYFMSDQHFDYLFCESLVLVPVLLTSGLDMIEQIAGKPIVKQMLNGAGDLLKKIARN
jgi:hypothetical protein